MREIIYDRIGTNYNETRQADPFITRRLYELLKPTNDGFYLDIGCGTGNYTIALSEFGMNLCGIEPSERMLKEAQLRSNRIKWISGSAEKIKENDKIFSGAIATLTIHHWSSLDGSFKELNRVLIDDGKIVIFTSTSEQMKGYWLNHYFPKMLHKSTDQMPSLEKINEILSLNGFGITEIQKYFVQYDLKDFFLYSGKDRPELYFDEQIRYGISSFSALTNAEEVNTGLLMLQSDLENDRFQKIKHKYENDSGDYLFIVANKQ